VLTYAPDAAARTGRVGIVGDQQSGDLGETTRSRLPGDRRFPRAVDTAVADNGAVSNEIPLPVARRFLALRHLLAPPRALPGEPESVMAVVDRLGSLQFDPLEVAGRNHDLVLQARISGYRRDLTDELLYGRRLLFESYNKSLNLLPTRELPYYRIAWETGARGRAGRLLADQAPLAEKVLGLIEANGPQSSTDFERGEAIDWWWGPTAAARAVLEALAVSGRLGLARREGNRRYYDLVERLFPADLLAIRVPEREQLRHKLLSRYRAHGLLGAAGSGELWLGIGPAVLRARLRAELVDRGELAPVSVEGLKGQRFVVEDELPLLAQAGRELATESRAGDPRPGDAVPGCSFLAPLDPLMWDRDALQPLYGFAYRWEVYTPAAARRWGYYVLPILFGDRLVGRIEPRIDRASNAVRILGLGWEAGFDPLAAPGFVAAFADAMEAYLRFGGTDQLVPPSTRDHRALFKAISAEVPAIGAGGASRPAGARVAAARPETAARPEAAS